MNLQYFTGFHTRLGHHDLASLDVIDHNGGYIISRIFVPEGYRDIGIGNDLITRMTRKADAQKLILYIEVQAYGEMNNDQLKAWYERNGFVYDGSHWFIRSPQERPVFDHQCRLAGICDCGEIVEFYGNGADNVREDYGLDSLPTELAKNVDNQESTCSWCKTVHKVTCTRGDHTLGSLDMTIVGEKKIRP